MTEEEVIVTEEEVIVTEGTEVKETEVEATDVVDAPEATEEVVEEEVAA